METTETTTTATTANSLILFYRMKIEIIIFSFSFQVNLATQFFVLDFVIKINKIKFKQEDHKKPLTYWRPPYCFISDTPLGGP
jgi:hypothetical protein